MFLKHIHLITIANVKQKEKYTFLTKQHLDIISKIAELPLTICMTYLFEGK